MTLKNQVETQLPTDWGIFKIMAYSEDADDWMPHIVLVHEKTDFKKTGCSSFTLGMFNGRYFSFFKM